MNIDVSIIINSMIQWTMIHDVRSYLWLLLMMRLTDDYMNY